MYCLTHNLLKTAMQYLIIIQTLEPYAVSSRLQVDLLEKTLNEEEFELCAEIVRYLTSVTVPRFENGDSEMPKSPLSPKSFGSFNPLYSLYSQRAK